MSGSDLLTLSAATLPDTGAVRIAGELLWESDDLVVSSEWQLTDAAALIDLDGFQADGRFDGIDGSGLAVVILDTGIDLDHPFFGPDDDGDGVADRIVYTESFVGEDPTAQDGHGHGSNVSSIIASSDLTYPGVAPGVDIIHLQVLAADGYGTFQGIEQALQWTVANADAYNIAAVNMSLGDGGNYTDQQSGYGLADELAALAAMDVMTVCAAGNSFYSVDSVQGVSYPAADPNSLAVGAVYASGDSGWYYGSGAKAYTTAPDRIAPFSQRHTSMITVFAPGAPITGASATGGLNVMHGTSQAAPHVTGAVVLAQQLAARDLGRRLSNDELTELLQTCSVTVNDGDDENDNVTNTGEDFARLDMLALADGVLDLGALHFGEGADVRYLDADGMWVNVALAGPGRGAIVSDPDSGDPLRIELADTTDNSVLSITPEGASAILGGLNVAGSLDSLVAEGVDLAGSLTITGSVGTVTLGDCTGNMQLGIGQAREPVLDLAQVADLSIGSAVGIESITAVAWLDVDGTPDTITAPSLGQLAIRGSRRAGVSGDFQSDLNLTGATGEASRALGYVQIAGTLADAAWTVAGDIGRIDAVGVSNWSLDADGDVRTIRFGCVENARLDVSGSIRSILASQWTDSSITAASVAHSQVPGTDAPQAASASTSTSPAVLAHLVQQRTRATNPAPRISAALTAWTVGRVDFRIVQFDDSAPASDIAEWHTGSDTFLSPESRDRWSRSPSSATRGAC